MEQQTNKHLRFGRSIWDKTKNSLSPSIFTWLVLGTCIISIILSGCAKTATASPAPSPIVVEDTKNIPPQAIKYRRSITANTRLVWGINSPIALFSGQIEAESAFNPNAKSAFANGIAQFTPKTEKWVSELYPDLAGGNAFEPEWAFRAMAHYDKRLYDSFGGALTDCDRWAFTLSSYNGGAGFLAKDQKLTLSKGGDSRKWWGSVELYSTRSLSAFQENRAYPRKILLKNQYHYSSWGLTIPCSPQL